MTHHDTPHMTHLVQLVALEAMLVFEGESGKPPRHPSHAPGPALAINGVVHLIAEGAHLDQRKSVLQIQNKIKKIIEIFSFMLE